ncbi:hypothetical protein B0T24DRAFT_596325 [Lasiosphaeria ovina]|uniref:NACHT domain-containing protein n=1 Tax=Lasiosphaeria ovina TaxID=92902 RepID=A0AAE0K556_9PEZI|nr:hypothetical protein B0T24DRAFT_596325 [Lasiosphaeria ovina]
MATRLQQVYPHPESTQSQTDLIEVDVIAIHGLNTTPSRTFSANEEQGNPHSRLVNWLSDDDMLPAVFKKRRARIFTYHWNANTFIDASTESFGGQAEALLSRIHEARTKDETTELPIVFIASCFGGLLLAKALVIKGIAFLGTPFRGSEGAEAAEIRVMVAALFGATSSDLLLRVLDNKPGDRDELTDAFATLATNRKIPIAMFYETEKSDIANALTGLPRLLAGLAAKTFRKETNIVLVPKYSACLDGADWAKLSLQVKHAHLNKFRGPEDPNFIAVSTRVGNFIDSLSSNELAMSIPRARLRATFEGLKFPGMNDRFNDIYEVPFGAFGGPFENDLTRIDEVAVPDSIKQLNGKAARSFPSWVRSNEESNNMFWICGKPGAGKSTYMKFLVSQSELGPPNILIRHFFLLQGQPMQRCRKGMLCTLLTQLLDGFLDSEEEHYATARGSIVSTLPKDNRVSDWTEGELEEVLCKALQAFGGKRRQIYVCIDGLDEIDKGPTGRLLLPMLALLSRLRAIPGIRVVVSSRPEDALREYFKSQSVPPLLLQNITATEMYRFAHGRLKIGPIHEAQVEFLAERIVIKAQGVFLWVALVVKTLLADLEASESLEMLHQSLDKFPEDMAQLYRSIWTRRNQETEEDRAEAALYFQLLIEGDRILKSTPALYFPYWRWQSRGTADEDPKAYYRGMTLFHIAMASDDVLARSLLMSGERVSTGAVLAQCQAVHQTISARCAGIVEVYGAQRPAGIDPEAPVKFIHRTASDFLTQTEEGEEILRHSKSWNNYTTLVGWAMDQGFQDEALRVSYYTAIPAALSAFGPMKMSTLALFLDGVSRLTHSMRYVAKDGCLITICDWLSDFYRYPGTKKQAGEDMHAFFFFNEDSIPPQKKAGAYLFREFYPSRQNYCNARFLVLASIPTSEVAYNITFSERFSAYSLFKEPLRRFSKHSQLRGELFPSTTKILAVGYVLD